jgi:hypothetical protein
MSNIVDYSIPQVPERTASENGSYRRPNVNAQGVIRPKAKVWANIGIRKNGKVVTIAQGIAIDTMEPADTSGGNMEIVADRKEGNRILLTLQRIGSQMESGTRFVPNNLVVELYRVKEDVDSEIESDDVDLMELLTGPQIQQAAE